MIDTRSPSVPVVLDGVVCAPGQILRNFSPTVSELLVSLQNGAVFMFGPWSLADAYTPAAAPPAQIPKARQGKVRAERLRTATERI